MQREKPKISNIIPKEVTVFYEDDVPFINYVGIGYINGQKVEVSIPKMSMCLREIKVHSVMKYDYRHEMRFPVTHTQEVHAVSDSLFSLRFIDED